MMNCFCAIFLTTILAAALCGCGKQASSPQKPSYKPLDATWSAQLDRQRALIQAEIQNRYAHQLSKSEADLPYLQRLIDDKVYATTQKLELQAIGVCFGDILAKKLNLEWVLMTDPWGIAPTLRYKSTGIAVNALTMISKRVEESRTVNLQQIFAVLVAQVEDVIKSGDYEGA